jgi:predicted transcriptional regulator
MKQSPQRQELSQGTRGEVVGLRKAGKTFPEIEAELGVKADTARKIYNHHDNVEENKSAPRSGRSKSLKDRDIRQIKRHVRKDRTTRRQPLEDITKDLNLKVGWNTIREVIKEIDMGYRIECKRSYLSVK